MKIDFNKNYTITALQNYSNTSYCPNIQNSNLCPLRNDTVSFKGNEKLYRGVVGEEEIDAILSGEGAGNYATDNPNGWGGKFAGNYFITFKTTPETLNKFKATDDKRWITSPKYNIKDVDIISLGNKVGGKVVFSSDWTKEQKNEFANKRIQTYISKIKYEEDIKKNLDMLGHYLKDYQPLLRGSYGSYPNGECLIKHCTRDGVLDIKPLEDYFSAGFIVRDENDWVDNNKIYDGVVLRGLERSGLLEEKEKQELAEFKKEEQLKVLELRNKKADKTITPKELGLLNDIEYCLEQDAKGWVNEEDSEDEYC